MDLIFIRHAQPEWIQEGRNLLDPPLSALGRAQARLVADSAVSWKRPTELMCSSTRRAQETAAPIASKLGLTPRIEPWFDELRLPAAWEGAPAKVVNEFFMKARHRPPDEWWEGMPGGESFRDFYQRISVNLSKLLRERGAVQPDPRIHPSLWNVSDAEHRIVLVGHGGSNSAAISFLLGIEPVPWAWERFVSYHASISRLRSSTLLGGHIFGLRALSDIAHLPPDSRTR
jgi:broad specificity phosphatase PhoE